MYFTGVLSESIVVYYDRKYVKTEDGGQISLDFNSGNSPDNKKMCFIIHGLVGGSESAYIKHMGKKTPIYKSNLI
jgi:predicted alpha/beta-fold hydrolase